MESTVRDILNREILEKIIFSSPRDKNILKIAAKPILSNGELFIQFETFKSDNKAIHRNIPYYESAEYICKLSEDFRNINIFTTAGNLQILISKKGKKTVIGKLKNEYEKAVVHGHNKIKQHILPDGVPCPFLNRLGVCDEKGRIFDKKRPKYRQINKFLEIVRSVRAYLPNDSYILDLCCGKSYLSFALYWYLHDECKMSPSITGIDLKNDIIDYCNEVSCDLNFTGLNFISGNITEFEAEKTPDMVVSLHACDTATDIVLAKAVKSGTRVILSSPCCHHEMMNQLYKKDGALGIMCEYSMLKQKLCDALTDSLRAK